VSTSFRPPIAAYLAHRRAEVRSRLSDQVAATGITIIGQSADGDEALTQVLETAPDVALLAIDLPGLGGTAICRAIRDELPACRVLLLADDDDAPALDAIAAGAYGCYLISTPPMSLVKAIRGAMRREGLPSAAWAAVLLEQYAALEARGAELIVPAPTLTATERLLLELVAAGETPRSIAAAQDVTVHMVGQQLGSAIVRLSRAIADETTMTALTAG
jgi:DNA-binding NarL/FixJ family response regulator